MDFGCRLKNDRSAWIHPPRKVGRRMSDPLLFPSFAALESWFLSRTKSVPSVRFMTKRLCLAIILAGFPIFSTAFAVSSSENSRRLGDTGMLEPHTGSLLVDYYENYLRDHDIDAFHQHVSSHYIEGTLARLVESTQIQSRRAAILSLGLFGSFEVNAAVAKGLRDQDPTVRSLAENALWAIWFRADLPEHNALLEQVGALISRQSFAEAVRLASFLIEKSPTFAEAYNQRAIAHFYLGEFLESADDCKRTLDRNPFHTGALFGLAKCQLRLDQNGEALETLKRALSLQPFNTDIRRLIVSLEAGE